MGPLAASSWVDPERSLLKAAQLVTAYAAELASTLGWRDQFERVLTRLTQGIQRLARMQKRQNPPTTALRLLAVEVPSK